MDFPNQFPSPSQPPQPPTPQGGPLGGQPSTPTPRPEVSPPLPSQPPTMGPGSGPQFGGFSPEPSIPQMPIQIPVQSQPGATPGEDQIYTMPEKFLGGQAPVAEKKKSHKALTIVLILIIVLAVLAIIGGALYYFFVVMPATQPTVTNANNANVVVNNGNMENENENENENANENANENVNVNENENENENENTNANVNENENVNAETNENENTNVNTNENVNNANTNELITPVSSKDTDQDDLTNEEEKVWGTKADLPDTDSDGYPDGAEILAGYDPLNAISSGRLIDGGSVGTHTNKDYGYSVFYPVDWVAEALVEGDTREVLFTPSSLDLAGQFIEVIVEENPAGLTAMDWYLDQTEEATEGELETITTFDGVEGILSVDGYTAYFTTTNDVYAVSYRYGSSEEVHFTSTFMMMVKSFALTKKATKANDALDTNENENENTNEETASDTNTNDTNTEPSSDENGNGTSFY